MIALLLDEEEEGKEKTKRMLVREMIRERKDVREYHTLYRQLEDDESSFYKYFRMKKQLFYSLLHKIEIYIQSKTQHLGKQFQPKKS